MIETWHGSDAARMTELLMEYAPEPPFGVGRPELAPAELREAVKPILRHEMPDAPVDEAVRRRGF
jgi:cyclohexyl-isocyanide hydratase